MSKHTELELEADLFLFAGGYDFEGRLLGDRSITLEAVVDRFTGDERHDLKVFRDWVAILQLCASGRYVEAIRAGHEFIVA